MGQAAPVPCAPLRMVLAVAVTCIALAPLAAATELEVRVAPVGTLYAAEVEVGESKRRVVVNIDSGSSWLWVMASKDGAEQKSSSTGIGAKDTPAGDTGMEEKLQYADDFTVTGTVAHSQVRLGSFKVEDAPLLLVRNASGGPHADGDEKTRTGILGLGVDASDKQNQAKKEASSSLWHLITGTSAQNEDRGGHKLKCFFQRFWQEHPEVLQTFYLELGGLRPRMVVGRQLLEGTREEGGIAFLADVFTKKTSLWYTSVRAIGLTTKTDQASEGSINWNLDFNQFSSQGAPALLDSGAASIRLGHVVFSRFFSPLNTLLSGGCTVTDIGSIECSCDASQIETTFPTISISFEAAGNVNILGLEGGSDVRACVPPSSYVYPGRQGKCTLAIVDGGKYHKMFGLESIVLGVPFFRSTAVAFDVGEKRLGLGPPLPAYRSQGGGDSSKAQYPRDGEGGNAISPSTPVTGGSICKCADPKNWWETGHRFSPLRCIVVLIGTALVLCYVFVFYSPSSTAESLRRGIGSITGGSAVAGPGGQPRRRPTPDRPFVQMAGGPTE